MLVKDSPEQLASRYINSTGRHVFLTGRAGTGKTTFLRGLVENTHKKAIVAAPTGIAAINAGGVTLHSLFHLPFGCFLPSEEGLGHQPIHVQINTPRTLISHIRMHDTKRRMIRELELLIIDEVSMLRADLLDAIDTMLRHLRHKRAVPFGGVQLLLIGDMLQLPPVVKQDEWQYLRVHYNGLYFFQARALQHQQPVYIELEKIYRQSDVRFIALLNRLRHDEPSHEDVKLLNKHVDHAYDPLRADGGIFLTTHNHQADRINEQAMAQIKKPVYAFDAIISGDFTESQYPVDYTLALKEDARVMFIKNDYSGERRYFNGKIGTIAGLDDDHIVVRFDDGTPDAEVERYTWENKKYSLNGETNEIEERVAGTFQQYPLRLAWAITVHKSQGLTFERAVIDVSAAFAPGQIYVALSRLTGLEGLTLSTPLPSSRFGPDAVLANYISNGRHTNGLMGQLQQETRIYLREQLMDVFNFSQLVNGCKRFVGSYNKEEGRSAKQAHKPWAAGLHESVLPIKEVGDRFLRQLQALPGFSSWDGDVPAGSEDAVMASVYERVKAAATYFCPLFTALSNQVFAHIMEVGELVGVKGYIGELRELEAGFFTCLQRVQKMEAMIRLMLEQEEPGRQNMTDPRLVRERQNILQVTAAVASRKGKKKGSKGRSSKKKTRHADEREANTGFGSAPGDQRKPRSPEVSLELFRSGHEIEEIATLRSLAISTVVGHLAECVQKGKIGVERLLDKEKKEQILAASLAVGSQKVKDVMAVLGDEFTYADVRFALASVQVSDKH